MYKIYCISRATSGRLPSNDEILFGANIWISIRFYSSFQRFCSLRLFRVLSFAENALERYSNPHLRPPFILYFWTSFRSRLEVSRQERFNRFFFVLGRTVVYKGIPLHYCLFIKFS